MRGVAVFALIALVVVGGLAGATPPSAVVPDDPDNERPLADAGLDQSVRRGATVLLDATGSRDPDGRLVDYEWSITRPDGTTRTPDCADCPRTRFRPNATGRFAVTVTVTDDDGATATDTLYVNVSPGRPPAVVLRGPRTVPIGDTVVYTTEIDRGAAPLSRVVWRVDGRVVASSPVEPDATEATLRTAFPDTGDHRVTATVHDADDLTATANLSVTVTTGTDGPPDDGSDGGAGGDGPDEGAGGDGPDEGAGGDGGGSGSDGSDGGSGDDGSDESGDDGSSGGSGSDGSDDESGDDGSSGDTSDPGETGSGTGSEVVPIDIGIQGTRNVTRTYTEEGMSLTPLRPNYQIVIQRADVNDNRTDPPSNQSSLTPAVLDSVRWWIEDNQGRRLATHTGRTFWYVDMEQFDDHNELWIHAEVVQGNTTDAAVMPVSLCTRWGENQSRWGCGSPNDPPDLSVEINGPSSIVPNQSATFTTEYRNDHLYDVEDTTWSVPIVGEQESGQTYSDVFNVNSGIDRLEISVESVADFRDEHMDHVNQDKQMRVNDIHYVSISVQNSENNTDSRLEEDTNITCPSNIDYLGIICRDGNITNPGTELPLPPTDPTPPDEDENTDENNDRDSEEKERDCGPNKEWDSDRQECIKTDPPNEPW